MMIQIIDSQLLMFPNYKSFFYRATEKEKSKFELLTIKLIESPKDLNNIKHFGAVTKANEITLLVNPTNYQYLINLHMSRQKPNSMFLKMSEEYVKYYGFNC